MKLNLLKKKTAFVFSGGASLGSIEIGALKAIVEEGIKADLVLGTSVGSLNGAMYAYNPTLEGVKIIEDIWRTINVWNVFTPSPTTPIASLTTMRQFLISPKNLRKLITEKIPYTRMEETEIPLYVIGTDIARGEEVVFNEGLIIEALMSSACIPSVFPPQKMKDKTIVDGGVVNNAPISTAVRLGAERIVVFPIGTPSHGREPSHVAEMMIHTLIYILNRQLTTDLLFYKDQAEIILVPPPDSVDVWPNDFSKSEQLIEDAYNKVKNWLKSDGFGPNLDKITLPCNVHEKPINLMESIPPKPPEKAVSRVNVGAKKTADVIEEEAEKMGKDIKDGIKKTKDTLKEKLSLRKKDKKKKDDK
ncbi:patatin-like phospholipase family protein [Candidatus Heimdallarchaeota archaeon]|jgi:NTE family protein|nr:MAG: patatin-like phospholipase family protein [Candidatus Heimdallarchaeota archaeon]